MTLLPSLLLVILVQPSPGGSQPFSFFGPINPPRAVSVIAHRGAMRQAPENTAPALEHVIADAVDWMTVDVRRTSDGHHVLYRDEQANTAPHVAGQTLAELRALDVGAPFAKRFAGTRISTLKEALIQARGRINLVLDCTDVDPAQLAGEVIAAGMERQVILRDTLESLQKARAAAPAVALMADWSPRLGFPAWIDQLRPAAVRIDAADVALPACRQFQSRGIFVAARARAGDDRPEIWARLASAGVDWIETDLPEELIAWQALKAIGARRVKIAHHRGASRYAPENSLPALEKAIRLGADFVEFDIQTTKDNAFVLLHDRGLGRTTNGHGLARATDRQTIQALDAGLWFGRSFAGTRVPDLDEYLNAADHRVELYVDAKDIAPEALATRLKQFGVAHRAVVYQQADYLERLRRIDPTIRRMPPLRDPARLDAVAERVKPFAFDTDWKILSKELIDRCHAQGIQVYSDALGSHETIADYQSAIKAGIDLIQTDHPLRVLRAIELYARD